MTLLKHHLTRYNTFALIRSCDKDVYKVEKTKALKVSQPQLFDDLRRVLMDQK